MRIKSLIIVGEMMILAGLILRSPPPSAPTPSAQAATQPGPTPEAIAYHREIAGSSEYGATHQLLHWRSPLRIQIRGSPTPADRAELDRIIAELRELTGLEIDVVSDRPNVEIHFEPTSQFARILPQYVPPNLGFAWVQWDGGTITHSTILISSDDTSQAERSHLIREELTQSLGLLQDSDRHPDSIFYGRWTSTQEFSDLDRQIISLHYQELSQ